MSAKVPYVPKPENVAALVAKHTPEQLATAYLKATHRAREAELNANLSDAITGISVGVMTGNKQMILDAARQGLKAVRTHSEATSTSNEKAKQS